MPDDRDALTPASAEDLAKALAFAFASKAASAYNDAGEFIGSIVAQRLVDISSAPALS